MEFINSELSIEQLPKAEEVRLIPISPRYFKVLLFEKLLYWGVLLAALTAAIYRYGQPEHLLFISSAAVFELLLLFSDFRISYLSFLNKAFAVREHDIIYQNGWLIKKIHAIPFNRIQHCSVNSGYFERKFNLSSLKLYTAGGDKSDISIPGLSTEQADSLREMLIKKNIAE